MAADHHRLEQQRVARAVDHAVLTLQDGTIESDVHDLFFAAAAAAGDLLTRLADLLRELGDADPLLGRAAQRLQLPDRVLPVARLLMWGALSAFFARSVPAKHQTAIEALFVEFDITTVGECLVATSEGRHGQADPARVADQLINSATTTALGGPIDYHVAQLIAERWPTLLDDAADLVAEHGQPLGFVILGEIDPEAFSGPGSMN